MTIDIERRIANRLISRALVLGYSISIYDGEAWCLKKSRDHKAIWEAMFSTDMDTLRFRDGDNNIVGSMVLIYGNGEDVISDHTDNTAMNDLAALVGDDNAAFNREWDGAAIEAMPAILKGIIAAQVK